MGASVGMVTVGSVSSVTGGGVVEISDGIEGSWLQAVIRNSKRMNGISFLYMG